MAERYSIRLESIEVGERHRALSEPACERLATSMKDIGLQYPITIRVLDEMEIDGQIVSGVPMLVAGAHRLAAAKLLGWSHIDCIEIEDDAITAELWELAENLHRCDLTKDQRDRHIRRYATLLKEQVSRQSVVKPQGGRPEGVASKIAKETGLSKRTVERALAPQRRVIEVPDQLDHDDQIQLQVRAIMAAWNRACPEARDLARDQIDTPVFDRAHAA